MINYIARFIKRFAVLVPGIIVTYFAVRDLFPLLDRRLPLAIAIFFTYVITAYVLIPASIRAIRVLWPSEHLPLYCVTPDGFASDPLNIGLIGTRNELMRAMTKAGWYEADAHTPRNLFLQLVSTLLSVPYASAPMSYLYLFGRKHDIGFEVPLPGGGHRHHVRFWATTYDDEEFFCVHSIHWHRRRIVHSNRKLLWVGAASRDAGFGLIRHNIQISHMIAPDTNAERELIRSQLLSKKLAKDFSDIRLGKAYRVRNRVWRGHLNTDGRMKILALTGSKQSARKAASSRSRLAAPKH